MQQSPILIVDDDKDDIYLIKKAIEDLKVDRPVYYFESGKELEQYLQESLEPPFLVVCDLNLPGEDGFEVKKRISENNELRYHSVPFIYWSNGASEKQIQFAYDLPAQGFFVKPSNFDDLCTTFKTILAYWQLSKHPKRVK